MFPAAAVSELQGERRDMRDKDMTDQQWEADNRVGPYDDDRTDAGWCDEHNRFEDSEAHNLARVDAYDSDD